jgi:hypothetical protein
VSLLAGVRDYTDCDSISRVFILVCLDDVYFYTYKCKMLREKGFHLTNLQWIVPIFASVLYGWTFYTLILMTFMYSTYRIPTRSTHSTSLPMKYISKRQQVYATSALAGVCFARNVVGGVFPLFGTKMFENLGYR